MLTVGTDPNKKRTAPLKLDEVDVSLSSIYPSFQTNYTILEKIQNTESNILSHLVW